MTEYKVVNDLLLRTRPKKRGFKFEGKSAEVIENKWWKNVSFWPSAEVVENKARYNFPQSMLMKNKEVIAFDALVLEPVSSCI